MNDNIFEGANFGDKFLCKNGKIARYICSEQNDLIQNPLYEKIHSIWIENMGIIYKYNSIGESGLGTEYSIVSRYQEPINEDKLDELASKYGAEIGDPMNPYECKFICAAIVGFKAGYHKAKEG